MKNEFIAYVNKEDLAGIDDRHLSAFTGINIAFATLRANRAVFKEPHSLDYLPELRKKHPKLRIMASIGGGGASGYSQMADTKEGVDKFIDSIVQMIYTYDLDGIDLDWEFPNAPWDPCEEDRENYLNLLRAMREAIDKIGRDKNRKMYLTVAAASGRWAIDSIDFIAMLENLDYINLMTYDLRGFNQDITSHHTGLFTKRNDVIEMSVDSGVKLLLDLGINPEKIIIGSGLYSRAWYGVKSDTDGLLAKALPGGDYFYDYPKLYEIFDDPKFSHYYDEEACASYSFSTDKIFVTYDDAKSASRKIDYARNNGLGGMMFWRYKIAEVNPFMDEICAYYEEMLSLDISN